MKRSFDKIGNQIYELLSINHLAALWCLREGYDHDFIVRSNSKSNSIDYLLFLDSRMVSAEFDTSLAKNRGAYVSHERKGLVSLVFTAY